MPAPSSRRLMSATSSHEAPAGSDGQPGVGQRRARGDARLVDEPCRPGGFGAVDLHDRCRTPSAIWIMSGSSGVTARTASSTNITWWHRFSAPTISGCLLTGYLSSGRIRIQPSCWFAHSPACFRLLPDGWR